jgi:hypothetical protein
MLYIIRLGLFRLPLFSLFSNQTPIHVLFYSTTDIFRISANVLHDLFELKDNKYVFFFRCLLNGINSHKNTIMNHHMQQAIYSNHRDLVYLQTI